ncbi:MAG: hypothetical protein ACIAQZ_05245 [Sedimentisphaeraceae bacterium JB056]
MLLTEFVIGSTIVRDSNVYETLSPIRQGIKGVTPFWNEYAFRFIYVPSFNFEPVDGAIKYKFTATATDGEMYEFCAQRPDALLTPIWLELPIDQIKLKVEAIDADGKIISLAGERVFEKAAPYNGPYRQEKYDYSKSARRAMDEFFKLDIVKDWGNTGKPSPEYQYRNRYAAKMMSAVVDGAALYASMEPKPANIDEVLNIGKAAADYLLSIHYPSGSPVENFPPTYYGMEKEGHMDVNNCMITEAANAGRAYLDLYKATGLKKYLEAGHKIADTYKKLQLANGTWYLVVDIKTGEPIFNNYANPQSIINFLDVLIKDYGRDDLVRVVNKAVKWTIANPCKTFNWQNQFEDMVPEKAYKNLSRGEATSFAQWLLQNAAKDPVYIEMAKEIIMYSEDQFVVWSNPPINTNRQTEYVLFPAEYYSTDKWIMPCVCEQYLFWQPVNASSVSMISAYRSAYELTGEEIYMAKAKDLADSIVYAQEEYHSGRYLTYLTSVERDYWMNCTVVSARVMYAFGEFVKR